MASLTGMCVMICHFCKLFMQGHKIHTVRFAHLTCVALKEEKSLSWMKLCIHKQVISLHLVLCWGKTCLNVCIR